MLEKSAYINDLKIPKHKKWELSINLHAQAKGATLSFKKSLIIHRRIYADEEFQIPGALNKKNV